MQKPCKSGEPCRVSWRLVDLSRRADYEVIAGAAGAASVSKVISVVAASLRASQGRYSGTVLIRLVGK
jgi:hypothetical protein